MDHPGPIVAKIILSGGEVIPQPRYSLKLKPEGLCYWKVGCIPVILQPKTWIMDHSCLLEYSSQIWETHTQTTTPPCKWCSKSWSALVQYISWFV